MTEQYQQYNINEEPIQPRRITSTVAVPAGDANADDSMVLVDTTLSIYTLRLPLAASCPGREITIVQSAAAPNFLTVATSGGDLLAGIFTNPIPAVIGDLVSLTSDGGTLWFVTGEEP